MKRVYRKILYLVAMLFSGILARVYVLTKEGRQKFRQIIDFSIDV